jgi:hypothetical protein
MTSTAALSPLDTYLSCPGPARELLRALAGRVRSTLQPPPRAQSIAATLDEIADMPEVAALELTALQLCDAFRALSLPEAEDSPATAARRRTCAEVAEALPFARMGWAETPLAAALWRVVAARFPGSDGRAVAVRATWSREADEIDARLPSLTSP